MKEKSEKGYLKFSRDFRHISLEMIQILIVSWLHDT